MPPRPSINASSIFLRSPQVAPVAVFWLRRNFVCRLQRAPPDLLLQAISTPLSKAKLREITVSVNMLR
jgi:hypothetical protein